MSLRDITLSLRGLDVPDLDVSPWLDSNLVKVRGKLSISANDLRGLGNPLFLSLGLLGLLEMVVIVAIIYQARQFMGNIVRKAFFVLPNVKRLEWMGQLFFAGILISVLRMVVVWIYLASSGLLSPEVYYYSGEAWADLWDGILFVFICYIFAGIFRYGMKLKKDQELTI